MSAINFDAGTWTEWHPATKLPDSDTTVLVFSPKADEPVWLGYHDGELWCDEEGVPYMTPVEAWAEMPHPEEKKSEVRGQRSKARGQKSGAVSRRPQSSTAVSAARPSAPSFLSELTTPAFAITPAIVNLKS